MARSTTRAGRGRRSAAVLPPPEALAPPDGALLRLVVDGRDWTEHVPPCPPGAAVTVSFSSPVMAARHAEALAALGYVVVAGHPAPDRGEPSADFLVEQAALAAYPTWWRALAGLADRAYSLALGPVRAALAEALAPHLAERPGSA